MRNKLKTTRLGLAFAVAIISCSTVRADDYVDQAKTLHFIDNQGGGRLDRPHERSKGTNEKIDRVRQL